MVGEVRGEVAGLLFVIRELLQIEENHEGSHKQLQRLPNPQPVGSSEWLVVKRKWCLRVIPWLLSGVLISQLPQGAEGPGFPREPVWHMLFYTCTVLRWREPNHCLSAKVQVGMGPSTGSSTSFDVVISELIDQNTEEVLKKGPLLQIWVKMWFPRGHKVVTKALNKTQVLTHQ